MFLLLIASQSKSVSEMLHVLLPLILVFFSRFMKISLIWLVTFICIRKKILKDKKKNYSVQISGHKDGRKECYLRQSWDLQGIKHMQSACQVQCEPPVGMTRTHGLLSICDVQKWVFAALPTVPFMLQLDCLSPFSSNCPEILLVTVKLSLSVVPPTDTKLGEYHTLSRLS